MTGFTQHLRQLPIPITNHQRNMMILLGTWIVTMISVPIQNWVFGDGIVPFAVTLGLLTQFTSVLYILWHSWGFRRTFTVLATIAFLTWLAEFIGSSTGFPFGHYAYTDTLQPQLTHVPLIIPLAWFMMLPPSWIIAQTLTPHPKHKTISYYLIFAGISAIAMTAWDLFLDPQMVAWGFWIWDHPVGYFGIPWTNYVGWLLTAFLVTWIVRPQRLPTIPLLTVYGVVWFLQSFGQFFFWGQQGPAVVGFVVMGSLLLLAIITYQRRSS